MIKAGELRHRITFEKPIKAQSTTGAIAITWTPITNPKSWAKISPLSVREFISNGKDEVEIDARILIRYRADITEEMRIVHGSKIYSIEGLLPDDRSGVEWITIPAKLNSAGGQ